MSTPVDHKLYEQVKQETYEQHPNHSAYRSGLLVKEYKRRHGPGAYKGKENKSSGLNRWFKENWKSQRGEVGYKYKSDVYRPTVKVNKDTPTTFKELTKEQIEKARKEKARKGRVSKFDK